MEPTTALTSSLAEGPPVPLMTEAQLTDADLVALSDDLMAHAEVFVVLVKGGPTRRADDNLVTLPQAMERFRAGTVQAVQIRYRFDGKEWADTIMRTPQGIRMIRCLSME